MALATSDLNVLMFYSSLCLLIFSPVWSPQKWHLIAVRKKNTVDGRSFVFREIVEWKALHYKQWWQTSHTWGQQTPTDAQITKISLSLCLFYLTGCVCVPLLTQLTCNCSFVFGCGFMLVSVFEHDSTCPCRAAIIMGVCVENKKYGHYTYDYVFWRNGKSSKQPSREPTNSAQQQTRLWKLHSKTCCSLDRDRGSSSLENKLTIQV